MNPDPRVLIVSRDPMILQTRKLILGTYFDVECAGRLSEAIPLLKQHHYELILLCDTLTAGECTRIEAVAHEQKKQPTLLSLLGPANGHRRLTDGGRMFECGAGPLGLLKMCAEILGCDLSSKTRMFAH